jgi:alkylation response protein AidB-like acyl-CoA dehydrogenase
MSKLFAGETAVWVAEEAIQILGGAVLPIMRD